MRGTPEQQHAAEQRRALKRLQAMRAAGTGLTTPQQRHSPQLAPRDSYVRFQQLSRASI